MPYPQWRAGQRITAGQLADMLPQIATKAADTPRTSTTTATPDPELALPVDANALYVLDGLILTSSASLTPNLLAAISGPSGAVGRWSMILPSTTSTADPDAVRTASNGLGGTLSYGHSTVNVQFGAQISATISTGSTAGTVTFDWAQQTSDPTSVQVRQYSYIRLQRVS